MVKLYPGYQDLLEKADEWASLHPLTSLKEDYSIGKNLTRFLLFILFQNEKKNRIKHQPYLA